MLVTFCGMVGSGKTINSKKTLRWLRAAGYEPHYLRFRFLKWRSLWRTPAPAPWQEVEKKESRATHTLAEKKITPRRLATNKTLTLRLCLGYFIRALRFKLFLRRHHRQHTIVVNRYFYDNLAHYRLATARERKYLRWLLAAMPKPDLAVFLVLRPETAHRRRPAYVLEELQQLAENTITLQQLFPELKIVHTDNISTVDRQIEKHLRRVFQPRRKREHVQESHS